MCRHGHLQRFTLLVTKVLEMHPQRRLFKFELARLHMEIASQSETNPAGNRAKLRCL